MSALLTIALIIAAAIAAGAIFSPKFRQMLRIRGGKAVDASTTALEKQQDSYDQLVARLPKNRAAVAQTKANAVIQQRKLTDLQTKLDGLKKEYKLANDQQANATTTTAIETDFAETKAAIEAQTAVATEAGNIANEALNALEQTTKALGKFKDQIERDGNKVQLKEALELTAATRNELNDIKTQISGAGQASATIDKELETARAANDMSKGSAVDQDRAALQEKAAASSARDELRASLGLDKPETK
jgi:hypothetical protein